MNVMPLWNVLFKPKLLKINYSEESFTNNKRKVTIERLDIDLKASKSRSALLNQSLHHHTKTF